MPTQPAMQEDHKTRGNKNQVALTDLEHLPLYTMGMPARDAGGGEP